MTKKMGVMVDATFLAVLEEFGGFLGVVTCLIVSAAGVSGREEGFQRVEEGSGAMTEYEDLERLTRRDVDAIWRGVAVRWRLAMTRSGS